MCNGPVAGHTHLTREEEKIARDYENYDPRESYASYNQAYIPAQADSSMRSYRGI